MKIKIEQLAPSLKKNIAPLYLVSGDEFLLVQEACDTIRKHAVESGYSERTVFHIEASFNWDNFLGNVNNSSLFGDQEVIELSLKGKMPEAGSKVLQNYAKNPSPDKIILLIANKLDASQQRTSWHKAIDACGIVLPIWPIEQSQLPSWINNRLNMAGLKTDQEGVKLLADHAAGNLLAATQEIEKLILLYGQGNLTHEQIGDAIADNARFNAFNLLDAALSGNTNSLNRILDNLKSENVEPTIILWAITNELRSLINISVATKNGTPLETAYTKNNIWPKRRPLVKMVLNRHNLNNLQHLLRYAMNIDLAIKGADRDRLLWHEIRKVYLKFAKK